MEAFADAVFAIAFTLPLVEIVLPNGGLGFGERLIRLGGHMPALSGYIMGTPDAAVAFKVVLDHEDRPDTQQPCDTISECQAIIRHNTRYMASANQGRYAL